MNTVISLGGGVQSTILALSVTKKYYTKELSDQLPNPIVIMSDTGSEKPETLEYVENIIMPELDKNNIENYIVKSKLGNLHDHYLQNNKIPFRVFRSCTDNFKVKPMKEKYKELGLYKKRGDKVTQALGITTDEIQRVKPNRISWIDNIFPLIESDYSRQDCYEWFNKHNLPIPIKSGCFCCPFQSKNDYLELYEKHKDLVEIAVNMETNALKHDTGEGKYIMSLYNDKMTLGELIDGHKRQMPLDLFFEEFTNQDECTGSCFT